MSSASINEDEVQPYEASNVEPVRSRTRSIASLARTLSHKDTEDQINGEPLEQYVSEHQEGIERVLTQLTERAGALGPAESLLDVEPEKLEADPNSDFNEADEWKYPIDKDTGLRLVTFVDGDKSDPRNWPSFRKWIYTVELGIVCFAVAMASAIVTGDIAGPMETFNVSEEVVILTVTLFVLGFAFGPLAFAPLSEEVGRRPIYVGTLFFAVMFILPCALAQNIGTLLVGRAIDGLAFSAPMCIIGGSLADMFHAKDRGLAMTVFSAAPFLGPVIGPLVGGYIGDNVGWRWIYWVLMIFVGVVYVVMAVTIPETHHNTILKKRARKLRKITGDDRYRTLVEIQVRSFKKIVEDTLFRPMILLSEVIVFLITIYMSIVYGLLYMFFFAYPVVYMEGKGWSAGKTGLMFIPVAVGVLIASAISPYINRQYNRRAQKYIDQGQVPPPELRLIPMMIACWFVPIGLFSYAWSSYPTISWAGPCFSGLACGIGFNMLYNPANNYIVDSYQHYAASALAAKTFVRSLWGGCVPLFTIQMYHRLGYEWASSLMAFIALACCAIPFGFYFYGAKIRTWSKYAYSPESQGVPLEKSTSESASSA